jgi:hypothetical protein
MLGLQDSRTARHIAAEQAQLNTAGFAQPDHPQDALWHDILAVVAANLVTNGLMTCGVCAVTADVRDCLHCQ